METSIYYEKVGLYYDEDAPLFEKRHCTNGILQKIRSSFRRETEKYSFGNALEVGFGPGIDLLYFAQKYPDKTFYGIDVSKGMKECARSQLEKNKLKNVRLELSSVEEMEQLFPNEKFDLIYSYFGALNTVEDLALAAECLKKSLSEDGKIVVTLINKWYWMGILLPLLKLRFSSAFKRLQKIWGGYSPKRKLESRCYSSTEVKKAFTGLQLVCRRGYSIAYPAWYQDSLRKKLGKSAELLWGLDKLLNKTFFWSKGEYTLFVFAQN